MRGNPDIDKIDTFYLGDCKISEKGVVALAEQIKKREKPVNQIKIFHYTCFVTTKRVGGAHLCVIAPAGNTAPFEEMWQQWQAIGNTVSNLTGPRFEPQTSRFRDEHVIAQTN